jgi:hypothetical protein
MMPVPHRKKFGAFCSYFVDEGLVQMGNVKKFCWRRAVHVSSGRIFENLGGDEPKRLLPGTCTKQTNSTDSLVPKTGKWRGFIFTAVLKRRSKFMNDASISILCQKNYIHILP